MNTIQISKGVMILGGTLLLVGGGMYLAGKFGIPVGRLPGDIRIERENFTFLFPLTTTIIFSILLTVGFNLLKKLLDK